MTKIAIYPGTFDPITNGHVDIIMRAAALFDRVIVGVAVSDRKTPYFDLATRLQMVRETFAAQSNVMVESFAERTVDFAKAHAAHYIVRGLRSASDVDYELQLAGMNRAMAPDLETVFLSAHPENIFVSATMVRELLRLNSDVSAFVPTAVSRLVK